VPDTPKYCPGCEAALPPQALSCPGCHQLVHAAELEGLARQARELEPADPAAAAEIWRKALDLLPPESVQAQQIREHAATLGASAHTGPTEKPTPGWIKKLGPLGVVIALLLKFKGFSLLLLTKAKFLFLGLAKLKTLLSMLATIGVYWSWYGWKFAVGFVVGIYIHEMGHVWALKRFGLRASAPMFIPGFGAFVSLYDSPADVGQDARIGLAGPLWGAAAAIAFLIPQAGATSAIWFAIARSTAFVNLFNLTPVWQLDGGRGFRALDRAQRIQLLILMAVLWFATGEGLFFILLLGAAYRVFWKKDHAPAPDRGVFLQFTALLLIFAAILALIPMKR
jgi:Zn-dependent protease